jgi:hypothetical protein
MQAVEQLIATIRECAPDTTREPELEQAKAELLGLARGPDASRVRSLVEGALRGALLEVRWELEEVLEESDPNPPAPAAEPEPEPEEEPEQPAGGDDELIKVYDDPRGLQLHATRDGARWFATQVDPDSGQPQTFELPPHQIAAVQQQLAGSPYWLISSGM